MTEIYQNQPKRLTLKTYKKYITCKNDSYEDNGAYEVTRLIKSSLVIDVNSRVLSSLL